MKTQREIAKWLKEAAKDVYKTKGESCASFFIDEYDHTLSLSVGWLGGYDPDYDDGCYHAPENKTFAINAAIVKYNPYDCASLTYMDMPYDEKSGDVWDTQTTLGPKDNYIEHAKWFKKEFIAIQKAMEKGELV